MRKISLERIAHLASRGGGGGGIGVGERTTVSAGGDNGANDLLASHFWHARRHQTTTQAVDNLASREAVEAALESLGFRSYSSQCNVGGHGAEGFLETGEGQSGPFNNNQHISLWNESTWGPQLDRLQQVAGVVVSIQSCHVGAGQAGADLLFAMAGHVGGTVRAGTGFLFSDAQNTWWEHGTQWQVASPNYKPTPIAAPSARPIMDGELVFLAEGKEFGVDMVDEVHFTSVALGGRAAATKSVSLHQAKEVVEKLFVSSAIDMGASVAAMTTGRIQIAFQGRGVVDFEVCNNRLAIDHNAKVAYYLSPGLRDLVDSL